MSYRSDTTLVEPSFTATPNPYGGMDIEVTDPWGDTLNIEVHLQDNARHLGVSMGGYPPVVIPEGLLIQVLQAAGILTQVQDGGTLKEAGEG